MAVATIGNCKDCLFYEKGYDGKPGNCNYRLVADIWNGYDKLPVDWVGYSDESYSKEFSTLMVGEMFGCIHFREKNNDD